MAYCHACKLFADRERHFTSGFNDWKHISRLHEYENSESHRNASLSAASFKTKNARVDHSFLVQIDTISSPNNFQIYSFFFPT